MVAKTNQINKLIYKASHIRSQEVKIAHSVTQEKQWQPFKLLVSKNLAFKKIYEMWRILYN